MKKNILIALLLILVVACSNKNMEYSSLEKALIAILEQKDEETVTKLLYKSVKTKNS